MAHYRIYELDRAGYIVDAADCDCSNDEEACLAASDTIRAGEQAEVWQGARVVRRVTGIRASGRLGPESGVPI